MTLLVNVYAHDREARAASKEANTRRSRRKQLLAEAFVKMGQAIYKHVWRPRPNQESGKRSMTRGFSPASAPLAATIFALTTATAVRTAYFATDA